MLKVDERSPLISQAPPSALGQVLRGQYIRPYRSNKGKLKGLILQSSSDKNPAEYTIKLPKYLRTMLVGELQPGAMVQVVAYLEDDIWQALNVSPWANAEGAAAGLQNHVQPTALPSAKAQPALVTKAAAPAKPLCIEVCRKGKCYKQGGQKILSALATEVEANPEFQHVSIKATGCMKACSHGPNLRVRSSGKVVSCPTPKKALAFLAKV